MLGNCQSLDDAASFTRFHLPVSCFIFSCCAYFSNDCFLFYFRLVILESC